MMHLQSTPNLLKVAQNVVWFKEPEETLREPIHFLAYAMRYGTAEDLMILRKEGIDLPQYSEVLDKAPAGVFDRRSWTFWNRKCGKTTVPSLPVRQLMKVKVKSI